MWPNPIEFRLRLRCSHDGDPEARLGTITARGESLDGWTDLEVSGRYLAVGPEDVAYPSIWRFLAIECPICGARKKLSRKKVLRLIESTAPKTERKAEAKIALPFRAL